MRPTSTVLGSHCTFTTGGRFGAGAGAGAGAGSRRRGRRRRHVHAHARVVADPDLPVDEVGRLLVRVVREEGLPILHRDVPRHAAAQEEAAPVLPREPDVRLGQALRRRDRRRDTAVAAHHQAGPDRRDVVARDRPHQFERAAQRGARRVARPHAPAERPARNVEALGRAPDFIPRHPRQFDTLPQLLAADEVEPEIGLPGRRARVLVARRHLHHPADRQAPPAAGGTPTTG